MAQNDRFNHPILLIYQIILPIRTNAALWCKHSRVGSIHGSKYVCSLLRSSGGDCKKSVKNELYGEVASVWKIIQKICGSGVEKEFNPEKEPFSHGSVFGFSNVHHTDREEL